MKHMKWWWAMFIMHPWDVKTAYTWQKDWRQQALCSLAAVFPMSKTMSWVEARIGTGREQSQVTDFQLAAGWGPLARCHPTVLQPCAEQPGYLAASSSRTLAMLSPLWEWVKGLAPLSPSWRVPPSMEGTEEEDLEKGWVSSYLSLYLQYIA